MPRVLLLAATTGYQVRAFGEAAEQLGVDLVLATDRCDMLDDPWRDGAIPVRFHDPTSSVNAILQATRGARLNGVVAVGDRPTVIAAHVLQACGLPGHSPEAAAVARNKLKTRERLRDAGLPVPWFAERPVQDDPCRDGTVRAFPAVVKPLALSGSRGVMRVDNQEELASAFTRLRTLLASAEVVAERSDAHGRVLIEGFIDGPEFAVEALMNRGALHVLAIFDKPDPLDGPFFEETIYLTPSSASSAMQRAIVDAIARAAAALGLFHGPIHAECRANALGIFVLEVAARPIGGLCARALRFIARDRDERGPRIPLEELLLRHALGEPSTRWHREETPSGVMMIPIPRRGILRRVSGVEAARGVPGIEGLYITAKPDQVLIPLPEGASYLGFIFARGRSVEDVALALRTAHAHLTFELSPEVRVLQSHHG